MPTEGSTLAFESDLRDEVGTDPKGLMRRHLLAIAVILTVATGCDNVGWGGLDFELRPPPPTVASDTGTVETDAPEEAEVEAEIGPPLLAGIRDGSRATLAVVGTLQGDAIAPLPEASDGEPSTPLADLTPGSSWTLFSEGVRVGSLVADGVELADEYCPSRTIVSGVVELVPPASGAVRLMALPASVAEGRAYGTYRSLTRDYDQGVASLSMARAAIPRVGAPFPPNGVLAARQDIQAFEMEGVPGQSIAATFLYQDQLAVSPPGQGAYALFVLGAPTGDSYREAFVWYRAVDTEGKGAPGYFGHLDWDLDGEAEILLDVFGSNRRWFASLARRGGAWVRTFQDVCGSGMPPGA